MDNGRKLSPPQSAPVQQGRGCITVIIGPMFGGKTSEMIRLVDRRIIAGQTCVIFKRLKDNRYAESNDPNGEPTITTHPSPVRDSQRVSAVAVNNVNDALKYLQSFEKTVDVCAFDEGQFFEGIDAVVEDLCDANIDVFVSCLQSDYLRRAWPSVAKLLPIADHVIQKHAVCAMCSDDCASFTMRITNEKSLEVIGADEHYKAVCGACYKKHNKMQ